jgi:uncharacterized coiled-coil protein SlyX
MTPTDLGHLIYENQALKEEILVLKNRILDLETRFIIGQQEQELARLNSLLASHAAKGNAS